MVAAKLSGELAERVGQPAVLGELVAGLILGSSVLGIVDPADPVLAVMAEIGVLILLFGIGLETDLRRLLSVGSAASMVAAVGVVLPFALGYAVARALGLELIAAIVCGAALTATSVGITARVLSDLGRLNDREGQIVLGAAVIDDVLGLVILAVVSGMVAGQTPSIAGVLRTLAVAFGFLAGAVLLGRLVVPPLFGLLSRIGREQTLATMALALAFLTAVLAESAGSALIIGAFAAGLIFQPTPHAHAIEKGTVRLGHFFVPIFFVIVGASVDVGSFAEPAVLILGLSLIVVAVFGKLAAGYAPWWLRARKSVIGVGMVPRGEVGLIFAQMGLATGALAQGEFSALMLMVMVTTFLAPPALKHLVAREPARPPEDTHAVAELTTEA